MENLTETDKAYMAGFIDGEGCITIGKSVYKNRKPAYSVRLVLSQKHPDVLLALRKKFGGYGIIYTATYVHQWAISSNQALEIISAVYKYLFIKKEHADLVFEFSKTRMVIGRYANNDGVRAVREEMYQKIKSMNSGKAPLPEKMKFITL